MSSSSSNNNSGGTDAAAAAATVLEDTLAGTSPSLSPDPVMYAADRSNGTGKRIFPRIYSFTHAMKLTRLLSPPSHASEPLLSSYPPIFPLPRVRTTPNISISYHTCNQSHARLLSPFLTLSHDGPGDADLSASAAATVAAAREVATMSGEVLRKVIGDLKELEGEAASRSVKEGIADQRRQLTELMKANVQKRWRKAVTGDETKRVRDHIRDPPVARRIDKLAFTFGVLNLTVSEFMLVKMPHLFWAWYMAVVPVLIFFRIPHYKSLRWSYFLLDFCK